MNTNPADISKQQQQQQQQQQLQYASQPQQQVQYQYQVQKLNTLFKPPSQNKHIQKQPIFNQQKTEIVQHTAIENTTDVRQNIQKRESLPKNFQYRVTSLDNKNKENLTLIQQNSPHQLIHQRDRSYDPYQNMPSANIMHITQHITNPVNNNPISTQNINNNTIVQPSQYSTNTTNTNINTNTNATHNNNNNNANINYTSQQQNKQLFQQQHHLSSNSSISTTQPKTSTTGQSSPIPPQKMKSHHSQPSQQQQQQQLAQQNITQPPRPTIVHQMQLPSDQIPINVIQDIVKAEIKAALQNFKQEEKIENMSKKGNEFEDKWDQHSLKQLIHVENTQTTNEVYQFISELKEDFAKKLVKINDQLNLNSESCKSNAHAVSQVQEKMIQFNQEYSNMTNQLLEDKKQIQLQFTGIDDKYKNITSNIIQLISETEAKLKKLLMEEAIKIEKQVQILNQEVNKRPNTAQDPMNYSPQKISQHIHQHNKSYDSLQMPQNSNRSVNLSVNTSQNSTMHDYSSVVRENQGSDFEQNHHANTIQHSKNTTSQQQIPTSPSQSQQDQYNYSTRNSAQYSRRSHTEQNTSSSSAQNVPLQSPQTKVPQKYETYVKKYEDFNKEVDNYLQNRKIPAKVQELMNQSAEMKASTISDPNQQNIVQTAQIQQMNSSLISPRPTLINRPLITQSPNMSIISPSHIEKTQNVPSNEAVYNFTKDSSSFPHQKQSNINVTQIQQQDLKRINYQSLQQNRKAFEDYNGNSINSSTQISPSRAEQVNLDMDSFNNEIKQSHNKKENHNIGTLPHQIQQQKEGNHTSPSKQSSDNLKFSIIRSQSKNPQLSMISEQDNEEEELIYQLDDNGYLMDENGNYIHDDKGNQVKLSGDQIEYLRNQNILEE